MLCEKHHGFRFECPKCGRKKDVVLCVGESYTFECCDYEITVNFPKVI